MISGKSQDRRLVPHWRPLADTLKSRELASGPRVGVVPPGMPSDILARRLEAFQLRPRLVTAAEAVEAAFVDGRLHGAVDAARRLVLVDTSAAPLIRQQAARLLRATGHANDLPVGFDAPTADRRAVRLATRVQPTDSLAWVELALTQVRSGAGTAAERSMRVARQLTPNNRHVLRCASRLYLHLRDPERAHDVVARSPALLGDPWLMAAEIALASVAGRPSRAAKVGSRSLDAGGIAPDQLTELAGALATLDMEAGSHKRSRKRFRDSMADPTANAMAQVEWASSRTPMRLSSVSRLERILGAHEAMVRHAEREWRFADSAAISREWADYDGFSIQPYEFGAFGAAMAEDFDASIKFAQDGLAKQPVIYVDGAKQSHVSPRLINSLVFALISTDRLDDAWTAVRRFPFSDLSQRDPQRLVMRANLGLFSFRAGRPDEGRRLYREAIDGFQKLDLPDTAAHASVFFAREALRAEQPDAATLLSAAEQGVTRLPPEAPARYVLDQVKTGHAPVSPKRLEADRPLRFAWSTPGSVPRWETLKQRLTSGA